MAKSSLVYNIELSKMYIQQRLTESIAENLRRQFNYDVATYVQLCKDVLLEAGLDAVFIRDLMWNVVNDAYVLHLEYLHTGIYTYHNGSGQHPYLLVFKEAQDLSAMIRLLKQ
ncbi:hypothetical protein P9314_00450 [Paenibacillus validus]|uniref:hypothetical protein n=1 Tax=Paenibacillus validus TaxID=44253 RepID=UPI0006D01E06|nr:hypothetical protein [Paenibacillus validus]MED4599180.1 hypothetical protein [Paenibacillus validus]MED4606513.1 hypothetical protein [Paenibacillus validus]